MMQSTEEISGEAMQLNPSRRIPLQVTLEPEAAGLPLPRYATEHAAGMDLLAAIPAGEEVILKPGKRALISTGLRIAVPVGYEAQVRARSGLAVKQGIGLVNAPGTIDADYRGVVGVILINWGEEDFIIRRGDRIAQLVIAPVMRAEIVTVDSLDATDRGSGGFGSTGVNHP